MRRAPVLLFALAGALVVYLLSRTKAGQGAIADAVDYVSVTARKLPELASQALETVTVTAKRLPELFLPRGIRNNNPGNLRYIARNPWNGQVGDDGGGYGVYESMALGVRAAGRQLLAYQRRGLDTVREIITTWAPSIENDTAAYIAAVSSSLGVSPDQRIDVDARLVDLAEAIFRHENGGLYGLSLDDIAAWVRL